MRRFQVDRTAYNFGLREHPNGYRGLGYDLGHPNVYGVAIAPSSEVRGIRVRDDSGNVLDCVEGQPVVFASGSQRNVQLSGLDYTSGRLEVLVAESPADAMRLVQHEPSARARLSVKEANVQNERFRLHRPRGTVHSRLRWHVTMYGVTAPEFETQLQIVVRGLWIGADGEVTTTAGTADNLMHDTYLYSTSVDRTSVNRTIGGEEFEADVLEVAVNDYYADPLPVHLMMAISGQNGAEAS